MKLIKIIAPLAVFACVSTMNAQSDKKIDNKANSRFKQLDKNGDGKMTYRELVANDKAAQGDKYDKKQTKNKFQSFDKNEDKKVTKEEFKKVFVAFLKKKRR